LWRKTLGRTSPWQEMLLTHAATCQVIAEDAQARLLSGDPSMTAAELTKLVNIANRAVRQLGLPVAGERERKVETGWTLK
jgi:hypothetical protein